MADPLLSIFNNHGRVKGSGDPPIVTNSKATVYVGYFENEHGEQWVFTYDRRSKRGELRGGDIGRNEPVEIIDGYPGDLILGKSEVAWLMACWCGATFEFPALPETK